MSEQIGQLPGGIVKVEVEVANERSRGNTSDNIEGEKEDDKDAEVLGAVASLLSNGPWVPSGMEAVESLAGKLLSLGERLVGWKEWERLGRMKEETNRDFTQRLTAAELQFEMVGESKVELRKTYDLEVERRIKAERDVVELRKKIAQKLETEVSPEVNLKTGSEVLFPDGAKSGEENINKFQLAKEADCGWREREEKESSGISSDSDDGESETDSENDVERERRSCHKPRRENAQKPTTQTQVLPEVPMQTASPDPGTSTRVPKLADSSLLGPWVRLQRLPAKELEFAGSASPPWKFSPANSPAPSDITSCPHNIIVPPKQEVDEYPRIKEVLKVKYEQLDSDQECSSKISELDPLLIMALDESSSPNQFESTPESSQPRKPSEPSKPHRRIRSKPQKPHQPHAKEEIRHWSINPETGVHKCDLCPNEFGNHKSMYMHYCMVHRRKNKPKLEKQNHPCKICGITFPFQCLMSRHTSNVHRWRRQRPAETPNEDPIPTKSENSGGSKPQQIIYSKEERAHPRRPRRGAVRYSYNKDTGRYKCDLCSQKFCHHKSAYIHHRKIHVPYSNAE